MNNQEILKRCVPIENIFLTGIEDIDNDPRLKEMREKILNNKMEQKDKKSLYVIEFEDKSVKIGVSKNPEKRIKTIERNSGRIAMKKYISEQVSNSFEIESKLKNKFKNNFVEHDGIKTILICNEKELAIKFKNKNIKGEFYNLDFNKVVYFVNKFLKEVV